MKAADLVLRCYAESAGDQWQVFCLDLNLAAQADTFEEAKVKLEQMICSYVYDALVGEDREYAEQLLNRPAPIKFWAKYYSTRTLQAIGVLKKRRSSFILALTAMESEARVVSPR